MKLSKFGPSRTTITSGHPILRITFIGWTFFILLCIQLFHRVSSSRLDLPSILKPKSENPPSSNVKHNEVNITILPYQFDSRVLSYGIEW